MIRNYHNHKPQTTVWHHEEEPHNNRETPGRQSASIFPFRRTNHTIAKNNMFSGINRFEPARFVDVL